MKGNVCQLCVYYKKVTGISYTPLFPKLIQLLHGQLWINRDLDRPCIQAITKRISLANEWPITMFKAGLFALRAVSTEAVIFDDSH